MVKTFCIAYDVLSNFNQVKKKVFFYIYCDFRQKYAYQVTYNGKGGRGKRDDVKVLAFTKSVRPYIIMPMIS